jgi:3-oxoacyl-(acyl-carrier-protein) synthase
MRALARALELAEAACRGALADTVDRDESRDPLRMAIILGFTTADFDDDVALRSGIADLSRGLGISGPTSVITTASAAGASALGYARELLLADEVDGVVACGVDVVELVPFYALGALRVLAREGSRPFAADRRGIRISEAAGAVVLRRGPDAGRSFLRGFGCSNLASQAVRPESEGIAQAVRAALRDAHRSISDIDYINVHGAGTLSGDSAEVDALREVFGTALHGLPLSSSKAALGHCQGAAGVLEAIATTLALEHRTAPPTIGLRGVDPAFADLTLPANPLSLRNSRSALSISCGLGGIAAALVFDGPHVV